MRTVDSSVGPMQMATTNGNAGLWADDIVPLPMVGVQGSRVVLAGTSYSIEQAEEFMSTARSMITIARRNLERSNNGRQVEMPIK